MSKIEVDQVDPQSGTTLTLGTSGDTVSIPSGVTLANAGTVTGIPTSALSGTIATAQIADDAVTLAKMAPGTDGNVISYDASGNPVAVATGSAGQVLTSAGAGAPPTFADAGGGGFAHIKTITASNVSSVEFKNGTNGVVLDDTYDVYRIFFYNMIPVTDGQNLDMQLAIGGTYQTGSNYKYSNRIIDSGTNLHTNCDNSGSYMKVGGRATGNQSGENSNGVVTIFNPGQSAVRTNLMWHLSNDGGNGNQDSTFGGGQYETNSAIDGLKFYVQSGNVSSGVFSLYGLTKG